jgi:type II secretory pathway pseudopilin PulG
MSEFANVRESQRRSPWPLSPPLNGSKRSAGRCVAAFTLVEMLVVTGIIALLVGLALTAMSGVKKRGHKATELNFLKQVGHAWSLYALNNNDATLPGYLSVAVQAPPVQGLSRSWGVKYEFPDRTAIDPGPDNVTGPWPWRLLSYLDYSHELIHHHTADHPDLEVATIKLEAEEVAYEPAFGYNGYYIGGHWDMAGSNPSNPVLTFADHCGVPTGNAGGRVRMSIPLSISQIHRTSDMVVFCAATKFQDSQGQTKRKLPRDTPGWHLVAPPIVGEQEQWRPAIRDMSGEVEIRANGPVYCPLVRYTAAIAVNWADGHVSSEGYINLYDQRKWINSADHDMFKHGPCP